MSVGSLAVNPVDGSLWAGTGEANESQDSYQGVGVWVTRNDGATWQQVGGSGPHKDDMAYEVTTLKSDGTDKTVSYQVDDGDKVIRWRELAHRHCRGIQSPRHLR